jgi:quercetin dioxygenase-like cupin family protein
MSRKNSGDSRDVPRFMRWADVPEERVNKDMTRRLAVGEREMVALISFKKGALVPAHRHLSEQITFVVSGSMSFTIHGKKYPVKSGEVLIIPSNVVHEATVLEDTDELDFFSPLRRDWLAGKDRYLRTGKSYLRKK